MSNCLLGVTDSIRNGVEVCNTYRSLHVASESSALCMCDVSLTYTIPVKFFKGSQWQTRFTQVAETFHGFERQIRKILQLHASVTISAVQHDLKEVPGKIGQMIQDAFQTYLSPSEREVVRVVKESREDGRPSDRELLERILSELPSKRTEGGKFDGMSNVRADTAATTVEELQKAVSQNIDQHLEGSKMLFNRKFDAIQKQLAVMMSIVNRDQGHPSGEDLIEDDVRSLLRAKISH